MDFSNSVDSIISKMNKTDQKYMSEIVEYNELQLACEGSNDNEGYQIFTPKFIVKQMVETVGEDILDFEITILEPTSGDGAFTTYILEKRLNTITSNFEIESLRALSTIYSIEMDKELVKRQRNNIFTLVRKYINDQQANVNSSYYEMLRCIIYNNFIWGMFNNINDMTMLIADVVYKMPEAEKGKYVPILLPVWKITEEGITMKREDVEV